MSLERFPGYAYEKLCEAIDILATGSGTVQERLAEAFIYALHKIDPSELPDGAVGEFLALRDEVTRKDARAREGRILATVHEMSDTAQRLARTVVEIYLDCAEQFWGGKE